MMQPIRIVDAFTDTPFKGNQAAVCVMGAFPADALMQQIAQEMNLSETAFLVKRSTLTYDLRWFTPTVEVNLCGHATLAATHTLLEAGAVKEGDTVTYQTQSGVLKATAKAGQVTLDFPALQGKKVEQQKAFEALGVEILACEANRDNYLVEVENYDTLIACAPDFKMLAQLDLQGVIITTATGVKGYDFASRYFGPSAGIDEDPVTGSAHCFLAPYWAKRLNKTAFHAVQASKRQGVLDVTIKGDRVLIAGKAVTVLIGQLQLPNALAKEKAA